MIKVIGLALYGPLAASHRYRLRQYISGLAEQGIELEVVHLLEDNYLKNKFANKFPPIGSVLQSGFRRLIKMLKKNQFDLSLLHVELFPFMPALIEKMLLPKPYIYDFDDAWYLRYREGRFKHFSSFLGNKLDKIMAGAAAITAGNNHLLNYATKLNKNSVFFPTVVDTNIYKPLPRKKNDIFTVGWIGSPSSSVYLQSLVKPLSKFGETNKVKLVVVGGNALEIPNVEVQILNWKESEEIKNINNFDVGVMPLIDDEWSRGKCAFKIIQYMACGIPVIASDVGANKVLISSGRGFLANNESMWVQALEKIKNDSVLSKSIGQAGRKRIIEEYSLQKNLPVLGNLIKRVVNKKN